MVRVRWEHHVSKPNVNTCYPRGIFIVGARTHLPDEHLRHGPGGAGLRRDDLVPEHVGGGAQPPRHLPQRVQRRHQVLLRQPSHQPRVLHADLVDGLACNDDGMIKPVQYSSYLEKRRAFSC